MITFRLFALLFQFLLFQFLFLQRIRAVTLVTVDIGSYRLETGCIAYHKGF